MTWMHRLRVRLAALIVAVILTAIGVISFAAVPVSIVITVAVAAVAVAFGSVTSRLAQPVCWSCGADLKSQPGGAHGIACPSCGSVNQPLAPGGTTPADEDDPEA
jgi:hypothetical protein